MVVRSLRERTSLNSAIDLLRAAQTARGARGPPSIRETQPVATDASRPTPEHFLTLIRQQQRGRLKIYLGFAAGVGKTREMLQEAQRLKRRGGGVAIGI